MSTDTYADNVKWLEFVRERGALLREAPEVCKGSLWETLLHAPVQGKIMRPNRAPAAGLIANRRYQRSCSAGDAYSQSQVGQRGLDVHLTYFLRNEKAMF